MHCWSLLLRRPLPKACEESPACHWRQGECSVAPRAVACVGATTVSSCKKARTFSRLHLGNDSRLDSPLSQAGADCVWCVSKAVPSLCVTSSDAAHLPGSVFACAAPKSALEAQLE